MDPIWLVKLGGSLLTDKRGDESLREATLDRVAAELAEAAQSPGRRLVLGHGGGSFGHTAAARYGLNAGALSDQGWFGVGVTQAAVRRLHQAVLDALLRHGARPFSLAPASCLVADAGRGDRFDGAVFDALLDGPLLPVVFGDVVVDRSWGASIASTESIFLALARAAHQRGRPVRRAYWFGETDGVYGAGGEILPVIGRADAAEALADTGQAAGSDVTGGMRHRVEFAQRLADLGVSSWIGNGTVEGRVAAALAGRDVPGTWVRRTDAGS